MQRLVLFRCIDDREFLSTFQLVSLSITNDQSCFTSVVLSDFYSAFTLQKRVSVAEKQELHIPEKNPVFTVVPEVTDPAGLPDNPFWHAKVVIVQPAACPASSVYSTAEGVPGGVLPPAERHSAQCPSPHTQGGRYRNYLCGQPWHPLPPSHEPA